MTWLILAFLSCTHHFMLKPFFVRFPGVASSFMFRIFPPLGAFKLSAEMLGSMLQQCHYAIIMGLFWSFNKHLCPRCTGDILSVPEITSVSLCFSQCWSVCSKVQQRLIMTVWHEKSLSSLSILDWYSPVVMYCEKGNAGFTVKVIGVRDGDSRRNSNEPFPHFAQLLETTERNLKFDNCWHMLLIFGVTTDIY